MTRRAALRLYAFALRAFPVAHRATYGAEMREAFARELARREPSGPLSAARFAFAASLDAIAAGWGERRRMRSMRESRRLWIGVSWVDVKLGARMLLRFPGLSIAGGLALAIAIGVGAGWYDVLRDQLRPTIPLPHGARLVDLRLLDAATSRGEWRTLHDYQSWRDLRSLDQLGAFRTYERNLIAGTRRQENVKVAAVTPSTFVIAGVPPLMGRPLLEGDDRPGSPSVVVIGYDVWQRTLGGDPNALGQIVQLGHLSAAVVGVMPEGFAFPISHHAWIPLSLKPSGYAPLEGPGVQMFGRLAPGATIDHAQTEVEGLVGRTAVQSPDTHRHLRVRISRYGADEIGVGSWLDFALTHLPVLLVLVIACANVGTLVYARTATREAEIAVRTALGAGRGRIVGQLFVEALILALIATTLGLALADTAMRRTYEYIVSGGNALPFWLQPGVDLTTVIYGVALAVVAAALLAVIPALKATGPRVQSKLRNLGAGGSTLRFGRGWTGVMIVQVALIVICLPPAMDITQESVRDRLVRARGLPGDYLAIRVELDREDGTQPGSAVSPDVLTARRELALSELMQRLSAQPGVRAVTFGDGLPGVDPSIRSAELELSPGAPPMPVRTIWSAAVGNGYFAAFDRSLRAGRGFDDVDRGVRASSVVVNEAFARRIPDGTSPIGLRFRFTSEDTRHTEPWLDIIGVVEDLGMTPTNRGEAPYVYRAASMAATSPLMIGVRTAGDPQELSPAVRDLASAVDAGLRLDVVQPLDEIVWEQDALTLGASAGILGVVALGMFLSAAGIFALMSVSVSRRTREIGLRAALGASRRRLIAGVFSHAFVLIGSGLLAGNAVLMLLGLSNILESLLLTSAAMLVVGLLACIQPARRALRVDPADALRQST